MYGKEYERNKSLSIGRSGTRERKDKERDCRWGWGRQCRTFPVEESLQHFRTGNSTNDTCYSWFLLRLNSPGQLIESSLYSTWILQLESFFIIIIAIASQLMTAPGAQWNEHLPWLIFLLFWQLRCMLAWGGCNCGILNINLQKGNVAFQTRSTYAAIKVIKP